MSDYIGRSRERDYNFLEQLHAVQAITQRDADEESSQLLALLVVELGYAIRARRCSVDDVIVAIRRAEPSRLVMDDVPTSPATPRALVKAKQDRIHADRRNLKWRRRWRDLVIALKREK